MVDLPFLINLRIIIFSILLWLTDDDCLHWLWLFITLLYLVIIECWKYKIWMINEIPSGTLSPDHWPQSFWSKKKCASCHKHKWKNCRCCNFYTHFFVAKSDLKVNHLTTIYLELWNFSFIVRYVTLHNYFEEDYRHSR